MIDTSPLKTTHAARGIGFYTKHLVESLREFCKGEKYKDVEIEVNRKNKEKAFDLIHYPYFDLFFSTLPVRKRGKTVVTIHDVTPLVFPNKYPPGLKGKVKFAIQKFSLGGVGAVITDSQNSKKDISKYLGYPKEKIYVVYLAPREIFKPVSDLLLLDGIRNKYKLPLKFVLYVGDVNWNKNVLGLVKACKKIGTPVVIVGKQALGENFDRTHIENKPLVQLVKLYGEDRGVLRLGFVSDEDLVGIYNLATVYCQPSFYEGFGLPILEAMACGCPVVSSKTSSLPEICGGGALMVDPENDGEMARGIKTLLDDRKKRVKFQEKGFRQVKKFTWEKTAQETLEVYRKVLKKD